MATPRGVSTADSWLAPPPRPLVTENQLVVHIPTTMAPALTAAYDCVTELMEQITAKDAPPTNSYCLLETVAPRRSPKLRHSPSGSEGSSNTQKTNLELPVGIGEAPSFETDASRASQEVSAFFQDLVEHEPDKQQIPAGRSEQHDNRHNELQWALVLDQTRSGPRLELNPKGSSSEKTMGHSSLAALCRWTLEEVDYRMGENSPRHSNRPPSGNAIPPLRQVQPKATSKDDHSNTSNSPRRKMWKSVWKRNPEGNSTGKSPRHQDGSFPLAAIPQQPPVAEEAAQEERKEEPRFQLFGSEYARHLVNPLFPAPNSRTSSLSSRTPLRTRRCYQRKSSVLSSRVLKILEEAPVDVRSGALLDICITVGNQHPPTGYYRISETASGFPFCLPKSSKNPKKTMYINVKKEPIWDKAAQRPCVNALCLIFPDRREFVPPGFCIVRHAESSEPANLSPDSDQPNKQGVERVYLCFRRSREGNPLTGILPLMPQNGDTIPVGYTVVERSPRNHVAHLSVFSSSSAEMSSLAVAQAPVFLAYRQRLANLESLHPLPLVLSVQLKERSVPRLESYYCTGGTVVASSVGRFHILDRSTHNLLSQSSVNNRLQLIERSRRRSEAGGDNDSEYSHDEYSSCLYLRSDDASSHGGGSISRKATTLGSIAEFPRDSSVSSFSTTNLGDDIDVSLSSLLAVRDDIKNSARMIPLLGDDLDLHVRLGALNFIPSIQVAASGEEKPQAMGRLPSRAALLVPILTACYTRHGGAALVAVEGLVKLLTTTNFFADDAYGYEEGDNDSSSRLTLLDLAVQTVCDVSTTGAEETTFSTCVEFVERALRFSHGQLNTRTIGYVVRFYLFVFYFGVSVPTRYASRWPKPSWRSINQGENSDEDDGEDFSMLLDPRHITSLGYLPGGSPQAAAIAFKELIYLSIVRLGKISLSDYLVKKAQSMEPETSNSNESGVMKDPYGPLMDSILNTVVDDAANLVERANFTQIALHQVVRSGGSELFWYDMINTCGNGLFGKDPKLGEEGRDLFIMVFAILANLVKVSSGKLRSITQTEELLSRDIASKLLSLELLLHFLEFWSDEQEAVHGAEAKSNELRPMQSADTFAFVIRRTIAPCLLWNTRASIENPQVFRRVLAILSELWCSPVHRRHCKVELGVLIDHFALRILGLGPELIRSAQKPSTLLANRSLLLQQVEVMREIKTWFSIDPKDTIELYLNFDTDIATQTTGPMQLLPGTQWKILQRLCASLSDIAERSGEVIGQQIRENETKFHSSDDKSKSDNARRKTSSAGNYEKRNPAQRLRKASLGALSQIVKSLAVSAAVPLGQQYVSLLLSWDPKQDETPTTYQRGSVFLSKDLEKRKVEAAENPINSASGEDSSDRGLQQFWRNAMKDDGEPLKSPSSTEECLQTAFEIAKGKNTKKAIEYLIACNALTPAPRDIANFLRIQKDKFDPVDLGNYISEGGTGGAETEYWNSIRYLFVRASSFVGMGVDQALRHFLTMSGFRLPGEAQRIDRVMVTFARCFYEDNAGDPQQCPFKTQGTVYVLAFAILMLNTDHHKTSHICRKNAKKMTKMEFINNLKGVEDGNDVDLEYLSSIFDSISAFPIVMHEDDPKDSNDDRDTAIQDMLNNVRSADSLLRGLAAHEFNFATIDDFTGSTQLSGVDALCNLTRSCVSKTWHHFHGVISSCMETAHLDPQGLEPAVEILLYSLAATICLGMPTERAAFLSQFGRLHDFEERRQRWVSAPDTDYRDEPWFVQIEQACQGSHDRRLWALQKIHGLIHSLQQALSVDVIKREEMTQAVAELKNSDFLLNDPVRSFIRSGDLIKKSARTGRPAQYRFYLFSDVLLYGNKDPNGGRYTVHEELPLHLMKILDWFPPSQRNRLVTFQVHHPRKSFQVVCSSEEIRKSWVKDIRNAIKLEMERKMKVEAARLSLYTSLQQR